MDKWKYYTIGHAGHLICNPLSESKIDEIIELLQVPEGGHVLDIACGKGEFLCRTAERWSCRGTGVDVSPDWTAEARAKAANRGLQDSIEIEEIDGAKFQAAAETFDVVTCFGASWIWGGHAGTLNALARWTKPGGTIVAGEPFWRKDPCAEFLEAAGFERTSFHTHKENVEIGLNAGLKILHAIVSSEDDFDRYEGYQWLAAERYANDHPGDPDVPELLERMHKYRDIYLDWGRETLGWAVYLFMKPAI